jgi:hypothetical protein
MTTQLTTTETHEELLALADRVLRLTVSRRDPERFHIDRDPIAKTLRALARRTEGRDR